MLNKKVLMVVASTDFRDEEYLEPRKVLEDAGVKIKVTSIKGGVARGVAGAEAKIDLIINDVNVEDFDGIIFVGGPGMAELLTDKNFLVLAKKFYEAEKLTTAICVAPAILASVGILTGRQATSWPGAKEALNKGGAVFTGKPVTSDGRIITASGPVAAKEFGEKIVEALKIK